MFDLDPRLLARLQFAFTVSFHRVFPAFTIGLASLLAMVEWRWLKTGDERFRPRGRACCSCWWAWFIALWCSGLCAALAAAFPIKLLIRFMG